VTAEQDKPLPTEHSVLQSQDGQSASQVVRECLLKSNKQVRLACHQAAVFVNGEPRTNSSLPVSAGDVIVVRKDPNVLVNKVAALGVEVVLEDDDVAIVWKPAGMKFRDASNASAPDQVAPGQVFSLEAALQASCGLLQRSTEPSALKDPKPITVSPHNLASRDGSQACAPPGPQPLAKATAGLVLVAKTQSAVDWFSNTQRADGANCLQSYQAVVFGRLAASAVSVGDGAITGPSILTVPQQYQAIAGAPTMLIVTAANCSFATKTHMQAGSCFVCSGVSVLSETSSNKAGSLSTVEVRQLGIGTTAEAALSQAFASIAGRDSCVLPDSAGASANSSYVIAEAETTAQLGKHTIRSQLSAVGHPVVGDDKRILNKSSLMVACTRIQFKHPCTHELVSIQHSPPAKFGTMLEKEAHFFKGKDASSVPTAYETGCQMFCALEFKVSPAVMIPRPGTEVLVQAAFERIQAMHSADEHRVCRVLDLGTGSGCVLLSMLHKIRACAGSSGCRVAGVGVDLSQDALAIAAHNAHRFGFLPSSTVPPPAHTVDFVAADFGEIGCGGAHTERIPSPAAFDVIVCNPPYAEYFEEKLNSKCHRLDASVVMHEPALALFAGKDGLDCYRSICSSLQGGGCLSKHGFLILEVGGGKAASVLRVMTSACPFLQQCGILLDHKGISRCVVLQST
jgi:release factor glutamine methyltransferase